MDRLRVINLEAEVAILTVERDTLKSRLSDTEDVVDAARAYCREYHPIGELARNIQDALTKLEGGE